MCCWVFSTYHRACHWKGRQAPRHESMNYSITPLIDSADDHANSRTSTHCDGALWQAWNVTTGTNKARERVSEEGNLQDNSGYCAVRKSLRCRPAPSASDVAGAMNACEINTGVLIAFLLSDLTLTDSRQLRSTISFQRLLLTNLTLMSSRQREWNRKQRTKKSGHSLKSESLTVTDINHCGHSG